MRLAFLLPLALLACSAVGFQPVECQSLSPDNQGMLHDQLYRDLLRGTYGSDDCFEFRGEVLQSIAGGYVVDTEGWGSSFPGDVFVRWEGDYRFVQGDLVVVTGAVAEPLTFETAIGTQRTIPAFYGSEVMDMQQRAAQEAVTREVVRATQQVIQVTKQVEYRADYEQRAADALQEMESCRDVVAEYLISYIQGSYGYSNYRVSDLDPDFSVGPAPDNIGPNTVPEISLEGSFTATLVKGEYFVKGRLFILDGQVTAVWAGEDCEFTDVQTDSSPRPTLDPRLPTPTWDPNVARPTYTPRPAPTKEMKK